MAIKKLNPTHLPANLKTIRRRWALNQEQLAGLLGLQSKGNAAAVISNWERGLNQPGLDYLLRLQDLTQLDLNRLLRSALTLEDLPGRPVRQRPYLLPAEEPLPRVEEPAVPYGDLYDYRRLVARVRELTERVERLEGRNG